MTGTATRGNLTLLEASANRRIANRDYAAKVEEYERSNYAITREIPEQAPAEWTLPLLQARQQRMAERAVHLWRSDFT